ncbi:MAG TPA: hypothetical protein VKZ63_19870 [Kofleriaceae bacterium]|nr:hypothetical protein [Kofleriaceae bacterium]
MQLTRLDNVLRRNRQNLFLDIALGAFLFVAIALTGLTVGQTLPRLGSGAAAGSPAPIETRTAAHRPVPCAEQADAALDRAPAAGQAAPLLDGSLALPVAPADDELTLI